MSAIGQYALEGFSSQMQLDDGSVAIAHTIDVTPSSLIHYVQIVDVTDPSAPRFVASRSLDDMVTGLAMDGDRLYLAQYDDRGGLLLELDLADVSLPVARSLSFDSLPVGFFLNGQVGYWVDNNGLSVVDLQTFSVLDTLGDVVAALMVFEANRAYFSGGEDGVGVLDVTDPPSPVVLGRYPNPFPASAHDLVASDGHAALALGGRGVALLDVSEPQEILFLDLYDTRGWAEGLAAQGTTAFLADGDEGLIALDVTSYGDPEIKSKCSVDGYARGLEVSGHVVIVLVNESGLKIFDKSQLE